MTTQNSSSNKAHLNSPKIKITMKIFDLTKPILFLLSLITLNTCVQDDDFEIPDTSIEEPTLNGPLVDIASVNGNLQQAIANDDDVFTFEFDNVSNYLEGYVISTDEGGNFFEEIIIQDKLENPTIGLKLLVDSNPLFTRYEIGRKIYVKLDGLTAGISNGVLALGINNNNAIAKIPSFQEDEFIKRSGEVGALVPLSVEITEFDDTLENLYIQIEDVQFNRNDVSNGNSTTFAAEPSDEFDGERILESCTSSSTAILSTSTFADFKSLNLPSNRGAINGILSRDFFDEFYIININSPEDINFDNNNRCDPIEISCGLADNVGNTNLFSDDFETQRTNSLITGNGWTNFIEAGTEGWEAYTQSGTNSSQGISARVGSSNSNDAISIAWLITPEIDLDINSKVTFQFETSNSFADGSIMQVLFSKDWDGTENGITLATWGILSDAYITQDSDFFGGWFESGIVDLSCESGSIYLAFKYEGRRSQDFNGIYELDMVSINAQ